MCTHSHILSESSRGYKACMRAHCSDVSINDSIGYCVTDIEQSDMYNIAYVLSYSNSFSSYFNFEKFYNCFDYICVDIFFIQVNLLFVPILIINCK